MAGNGRNPNYVDNFQLLSNHLKLSQCLLIVYVDNEHRKLSGWITSYYVMSRHHLRVSNMQLTVIMAFNSFCGETYYSPFP